MVAFWGLDLLSLSAYNFGTKSANFKIPNVFTQK